MNIPGRDMERMRGIATLELALILPLLLVMVFAIVDFGRLIQARLIVTNVSREGASLVSRSVASAADLTTILALLETSGRPLDLSGKGTIHITRIKAGTSTSNPNPSKDISLSASRGSLGYPATIGSGPTLGLSDAIYRHLIFRGAPQNTSDIDSVFGVEVYYKYKPITPLPSLISNLFVTPGYDGMIIGSRSVFE